MVEKILYVNDDVNLLAAIKRQFQKRLSIQTAQDGEQALDIIDSQGPFAVVVSDICMPNMDGIEFLAKVRARAPDTVCVVFAGNADLQKAIDAVNSGNVFRFLTKPCSQKELFAALKAGLRQYQLATAEKELTDETLVGSVRVLSEILDLAKPIAFRRASHIMDNVKLIMTQLRLPGSWRFELAAMLSNIGCVALPSRTLAKIYNGETLSIKERNMYLSHPAIGASLVANIPHLELVSQMIEKQQKRFSEYTPQEKIARAGIISVGAQILKVAIAFDGMLGRGFSHEGALLLLRQRAGEYNSHIVAALVSAQSGETQSLADADWTKQIVKRGELKKTTASRKILFVDGNADMLSAYKSRLRGKFRLETARSAEQALEIIANMGPFAVIVAGMNIPDMNSVEFLAKVKEWTPDSVRIMFAGNADLQTIIDAANNVNVFRFLAEPCLPEALGRSLNAAIKQYQLVVTENELIDQTLVGSVKIMTRALSLVNPMAFSRTSHIARYTKLIAGRLRLPELWQFELAATLSHIGCITLPPVVLAKLDAEEPLSAGERGMYMSHPMTGADIVEKIPRLGHIADMIRSQQKAYKDYPEFDDTDENLTIALGAQILKVATLIDQMLANGYSYEDAMSELRVNPDEYNPEVVDALESLQMGSVMGRTQFPDQAVSQDDGIEQSHRTDSEQVLSSALGKSLTQALGESLAESLVESLERDPLLDGIHYELEEEEEEGEEEAEDVVAEKNVRTKNGALLLAEGEKVSPLMQGILENLDDFVGMEDDQTGKRTFFPARKRRASMFEKNIAKRLRRFFQMMADEPEKFDEHIRAIRPENPEGDMVVEKGIRIRDRSLLLAEGQKVTPFMHLALEHISNFLQPANYKLRQPGGKPEEPDHADISDEARKPEDVSRPDSQAIRQRSDKKADEHTRLIKLVHLSPGMVMAEDVRTWDGVLLLARGQEVTDLNLQHLLNFHLSVGLEDTEFLIVKA